MMILQILSFIFSLLFYTVLIVLPLLTAFTVYSFVKYQPNFKSDFLKQRRMCTSTRKLTGQTVVVTGAIMDGQLTKQKFHYTFGTNYVGPFLLTYLLLDLLKKSAPSRIVNVTSSAHYLANQMGLLLEEDGIKFPQMESYECSKFANVLHTKELARQLNGTGVTVYTLHPGFIYGGLPLSQTKERQGIRLTFFNYFVGIMKFLSITVEQGAQTTVFCAVDESVASESGKYYDNCKVKEPNKLALDTDLARRLWNATLEVVSDYTKLSE